MRVGEWELIEELGRGGMGVVWRARGPGGAEVALKLLEGRTGRDDPALRERFQREVEALSSLRHEGLVMVQGSGVQAGTPWVAMQLLEGGSLQDRLKQGGPLPGPEAAAIVRRMAEAIDHAHGKGVLHRDLKPSNVLLDARGLPVVTDFGLAWRDDDRGLTRTGDVTGSPGYMSPEQADSDRARLGRATDVYGLGATLYALLSGKPPFTGSPTSVLLAILDKEPPRLPQIDPELEAIVLRCLAKEPALRFPTALALARALGEWLARRAGGPPVQRRWGGWLAAGILGVGAFAAAAVVWIPGSSGRAPPPTGPPAAPEVAPAPPSERIAIEDPTVAAALAAEAGRAEAALRAELREVEPALDPALRARVERALAAAPDLAAARKVWEAQQDPVAGDLALALSLERWPDWGTSFDRSNHLCNGLGDNLLGLDAACRTTELGPGQAKGWWKRASIEVGVGDHAEALRSLEQYRQLFGRDTPTSHYVRADALTCLGRGEEAVAELERGLDPYHEKAWWWCPVRVRLAALHGSLGHPERGLTVIEEALRELDGRVAGLDRELRLARARLWLRRGRRDEALAAFQSGVAEADPAAAGSVELLALRWQAGEPVEAELEAASAKRLTTRPRETGVHALRAAALVALGRTAEAERAARAAVALDPSRPEPRFLLAVLLVERGAAREAIAVCTRGLLGFDADAPPLRAGRALALSRQVTELGLAAKELEVAMRRDPGSPEAWAVRSLLVRALGNAQDSDLSAEQALRRLPERDWLAVRLRAWRKAPP